MSAWNLGFKFVILNLDSTLVIQWLADALAKNGSSQEDKVFAYEICPIFVYE